MGLPLYYYFSQQPISYVGFTLYSEWLGLMCLSNSFCIMKITVMVIFDSISTSILTFLWFIYYMICYKLLENLVTEGFRIDVHTGFLSEYPCFRFSIIIIMLFSLPLCVLQIIHEWICIYVISCIWMLIIHNYIFCVRKCINENFDQITAFSSN